MKDITSGYDLISALKELNPCVVIEYDDTCGWISAEGCELVLPKGFYYNEKNGITNKHNTADGCYVSVAVI